MSYNEKIDATLADTLTTQDGETLAYYHLLGSKPGIMFCGGFMSDMTGTRSMALENFARKRGQAFTRFDYRGHGQSSSSFREGTISKWKMDAITVFDSLTSGPMVLVGSSMGGWIALLLALARPERVVGIVGISAAPDFTEDLMWAKFDENVRHTLITERVYLKNSDSFDQPYIITMDLIEDGRNHLIMREPIPIKAPVRLLHGMRDTSVPYQLSIILADRLKSEDVQLHLVKDGGHRLSTNRDLSLLMRATSDLLEI
ncbi:alpha/beta hydrolase fold protein [Candidatus Endolissoclinum faulkneri L2]|uniref:Alpha/beta hydrolase fold protein n=1 Tax=Candidatus Endolissoclinum faulkneri L2 TaxID=1193729 RepID=K7YS74_9PROT|nr:alpha/beta hydrolase [Candidatus Endolissoclinum faulkneri]AFX99394.1 alpha/beta hydrolase fold protein [Candidatus Endolissoclinum faulkneri L2]